MKSRREGRENERRHGGRDARTGAALVVCAILFAPVATATATVPPPSPPVALVCALGTTTAQALPAAPQASTVTVQVDRPGAAIPPTLFGLFFEDINDKGSVRDTPNSRLLRVNCRPDGTPWRLVPE